MTEANYAHLIEHERIAQATERHEAAGARLKQAQADLSASKAALAEATAAAEAAFAGEGSLAPLEAERRRQAAQTAYEVAAQVVEALGSVHRKSVAGIATARGLAWKPVYLEGVRERVRASRKADEARAALDEAQHDLTRADDVIRSAFVAGTPHPGDAFAPGRLRSETEERHAWSVVGLDIERGTHPWDPGAY